MQLSSDLDEYMDGLFDMTGEFEAPDNYDHEELSELNFDDETD